MTDTDKAPMVIVVVAKQGFYAAFALRKGNGYIGGKWYLVPQWDTLAELAEMARSGPKADLIPVTVTLGEDVSIMLECDQEAWKNA